MTTKELRTASVSVCPERDIECGDLQKQWCETCPKKNKELSKQEIKPVAFLRYKNGKIDWGEDCLAADKGYSIDCYDDNDDDVYTEVALYPESTVTALRTEIEQYKNDAERLNWMAQTGANVNWTRDAEGCNVWLPSDRDGDGDRPAEGYPQKWYGSWKFAIDAAMKSEKEGKK